MNTPPLLSVKNLTVSFSTNSGTVDAVNNINFSLQQGETLAIVGESGSGKSVSTSAIMQLLPDNAHIAPTAEIRFEHQSLLTLNDADMRAIRGGESV